MESSTASSTSVTGVVHSAPLMWAEALDLLLQTLVDQGHDLGEVRAVAGSGQQHGTVYLNASAGPALARLSPGQPLKDQLAAISRPPNFSHLDGYFHSLAMRRD